MITGYKILLMIEYKQIIGRWLNKVHVPSSLNNRSTRERISDMRLTTVALLLLPIVLKKKMMNNRAGRSRMVFSITRFTNGLSKP